MVNIDMWYGDKKEDADKIDISFYPGDGEYRGEHLERRAHDRGLCL